MLSLLNSNDFSSHVPRPSHEARTGSGVRCLCVSGMVHYPFIDDKSN